MCACVCEYVCVCVCVCVYVCVCTYIPYRRKFSRHEEFTKSLKTGFSRLFIRETRDLLQGVSY